MWHAPGAGFKLEVMIKSSGYAAKDPKSALAPHSFERHEPGDEDVQLDLLFCGICHSDLHIARNEWKHTVYPVVPGHEIIGRVVKTGSRVKKFKAGDIAGVGCMVGSCGNCESCRDGEEQYCTGGAVFTYNSQDPRGGMTYGGYSKNMVVNEKFVLHIPKNLDPAKAAPLLCAGITTYSPLRYWKVSKGQKAGIVGLGGLGHMGVKLAHAMGAHVAVFSTSPSKKSEACKLGADEFILSTNPEEMKKHAGSFDFILDTVAFDHDLNPYLDLLKRKGVMCLVGAPEKPHPAVEPGKLIFKRGSLAGSLIGGVRETQEMLDFCGKHGIGSDVEIIPIQQVNEAYERILKRDVKYRFVIDLSSLA